MGNRSSLVKEEVKKGIPKELDQNNVENHKSSASF